MEGGSGALFACILPLVIGVDAIAILIAASGSIRRWLRDD